MRIAIIGTGMVAQSLAEKFIELNYEVALGCEDPEQTKKDSNVNPMTGTSFSAWYQKNRKAIVAPFPAVAQTADLVINATQGTVSLPILHQVGKDLLKGKVLLDIANPFDRSSGVLTICNTTSLGEKIQAEFPDTKVVKSLNTMNAYIMTHPQSIPGNHNVFLSGNDIEAKSIVKNLLKSMGWEEKSIVDLGNISTARGTEMLLLMGIGLVGAFGHSNFNFHIQRAAD